jgi:hypothetical protein
VDGEDLLAFSAANLGAAGLQFVIRYAKAAAAFGAFDDHALYSRQACFTR